MQGKLVTVVTAVKISGHNVTFRNKKENTVVTVVTAKTPPHINKLTGANQAAKTKTSRAI